MINELQNSQRESERHKEQRDSAIVERDSALKQRDSARVERDDFEGQNRSLENNQFAQEQFVATLSHDLRNPIAAIKMAIEIIRDDSNETVRRKMMDLIDRNTDQAGELISHLLDAHLIRSGSKLPVEMTECDLLPVLQKCQLALAPQEQAKIIIYSQNKKQIAGFWDARALERAFKNLISNALKFSEAGTKLQVNVYQDASITTLQFQNFGEIISLENQLRIFDSQVRIQQVEPQHKKGWGLGLTLVRGVAEAHGGKVEVTSSKAEGTTFTLRLPNDLRTLQQ